LNDNVAAVGYFDGVHLGHQRIIAEVVSRATARGSKSLVLALEPHPREVLRPAGPPGRLTSVDEKQDLVRDLGAGEFVLLDFTKETAALKAEVFIEDMVMKQFGVTSLVMGHDQRLGAGRRGDAARLRDWGCTRGLEVLSVDAVTVEREDGTTVIVSSTAVRGALAAGNVERASVMLGRRYSFVGTVVRGDGRGSREVGYPTANLEPADPDKLLPAAGVYAVHASFNGRTWPGVLNVGRRPTFGEGPTCIEVHVPGSSGPLYGARLGVSFAARLREERRFRSSLDLGQQIARDIRAALALVGNTEQQEEEACPSPQT
jgi:riboflavin kinase/FMN adenylyltransferase